MLEPAAACNPRAAGDAQDDQTGHQEVETGGDVLTRWSAAVLKTSRSIFAALRLTLRAQSRSVEDRGVHLKNQPQWFR